MKFKFRLNRRHNIYFTLLACGTGLWLMVARFGLTTEELLGFALVSVVLLVVLISIAALLGFVLRLLRDRHE